MMFSAHSSGLMAQHFDWGVLKATDESEEVLNIETHAPCGHFHTFLCNPSLEREENSMNSSVMGENFVLILVKILLDFVCIIWPPFSPHACKSALFLGYGAVLTVGLHVAFGN